MTHIQAADAYIAEVSQVLGIHHIQAQFQQLPTTIWHIEEPAQTWLLGMLVPVQPALGREGPMHMLHLLLGCVEPALPEQVEAPAAGPLQISEVQPNPPDRATEWVELVNVGAEPKDIRWLVLENAAGDVAIIVDSVVVDPGGIVLLGRESGEATTGFDALYSSTFELDHTAEQLSIVDPELDETLDQTPWLDAPPPGGVWARRAGAIALVFTRGRQRNSGTHQQSLQRGHPIEMRWPRPEM